MDVVIVDVLVGCDLVQDALAVLGEPQLDQRVFDGALGRALSQELEPPAGHAGSLEWVDAQRRVLDGERAQELFGG